MNLPTSEDFSVNNQKGFAPILLIAGVVILAAVIGGIYLLGRSSNLTSGETKTEVSGNSTPFPSGIPTPISSASNYKVYTNSKYHYSLNYPINDQVEDVGEVQCYDSYVTIKSSNGTELDIKGWAGNVTADEVLAMYQRGDHGCVIEAEPNAKNFITVSINNQPAKTFASNESQTYILPLNNKTFEITEKYKNDTDKKILDIIINSFSTK